MDGFDAGLKSSLLKSSGEFKLMHHQGFFHYDEKLKKSLNSNKSLYDFTPMLLIEGFLLTKGHSQGVLIHGVDEETFNKVTGLPVDFHNVSGAFIGSYLQKKYDLKVGDLLTLAVVTDQTRHQGAPILKSYKVLGAIEHGIFEKNNRYIYLPIKDVRALLGHVPTSANGIYLKYQKSVTWSDEEKKQNLQNLIGEEFSVIPTWEEFYTLIQAVKVEKLSIGVVLQLIVIISVFNIFGFALFLTEKKAQDFFLLRSLGLRFDQLSSFWMKTFFLIWLVACFLAVFLTKIFGWLLQSLSIFKLPGDIYVLESLKLSLDLGDYGIVFLGALIWILLLGGFFIFHLSRRSILSGLRQEFS